MIKPTEVTISIEAECATCGNALSTRPSNSLGTIRIDPCENCLDKANDKGETVGYTKGYNDGADEEAMKHE